MSYIFISYSHKDSEYVQELATTLEDEGFEVWIDERIDYGSAWPREIEKQLDGCGAFIVVCSPNSRQSDWVMNELNRALSLKKPIFPLLLEGTTWLEVEARQYVKVMDGSMPPPRFYDTLENVIPRRARVSPPPPRLAPKQPAHPPKPTKASEKKPTGCFSLAGWTLLGLVFGGWIGGLLYVIPMIVFELAGQLFAGETLDLNRAEITSGHQITLGIMVFGCAIFLALSILWNEIKIRNE